MRHSCVMVAFALHCYLLVYLSTALLFKLKRHCAELSPQRMRLITLISAGGATEAGAAQSCLTYVAGS